MNDNGKVCICRRPGDYMGGEIDAVKIQNVHWSCVSGGFQRRQSGWSLYGYIPYEEAMDLVACSGRHNFGYNDAKSALQRLEIRTIFDIAQHTMRWSKWLTNGQNVE